MSVSRKVLWTQGLFLEPQHFQQQERYLEQYVELRCRGLARHGWGFTEIEIDPGALAHGTFALRRAEGVFPDGTPFRMPADEPLPAPIDVGDARDQVVSLALPMRRAGGVEIDSEGSDRLARHGPGEVEVRDATCTDGDTTTVQVGALATRLLLASELTAAYVHIPVAQIVERRADGQVVLADGFIPTVLRAGASPRLAGFTRDLLGRLQQRGEALAGRVTATGRGGAAEIATFLMLQAINRYQPVVAHMVEHAPHPEELYLFCAAAAGELSTFSAASKRPVPLPPYRHERLRESFEPVMDALDRLFTMPEEMAVAIPVEPRRYGFWLARVPDRTLFETGAFVLGVRADLPAEEVRRRVIAQLKVGAPERIEEIVTRQLGGVPVLPANGAPRHIPFHAGFVYFEFDQAHQAWKELRTSGGVAMHPGEFPNLALEFWAIRA